MKRLIENEKKTDTAVQSTEKENRSTHLKNGNWRALFKEDMNRDWDTVIQDVFRGHMSFLYLPSEVSDTSHILIKVTLSGKRTPENMERLKQALKEQLKIYVDFCKIWTQKNPNLDELIRTKNAQNEATERWEKFTSAFNHFKSLEESLDYAFQEYSVQPLFFRNKEEEKLWKNQLKNEHREIMLGETPSLEPVQASLLDTLLDNKPHTLKYLLQNVCGRSIVTKKERDYLSRRISDLNKALILQWGSPPQARKNWIQRIDTMNAPSYQLLSPE